MDKIKAFCRIWFQSNFKTMSIKKMGDDLGLNSDEMHFGKNVLGLLLPTEPGFTHYIHRTSDKDTSEAILKNGFHFVDSFQKTTDIVINNPVYLKYWFGVRKGYGNYCVVLGISDNILNNIVNNVSEVPQILSEAVEEDDEPLYLLPRAYVKGYFNLDNEKIKYNPNYDPFFVSTLAQENLDKLK